MKDFKKYRRTQVSEMRNVTMDDILEFTEYKMIVVHKTTDNWIPVSISDADIKNGSPRVGDMIARNPKNHLDQWLVAEQYFKDNFEDYAKS